MSNLKKSGADHADTHRRLLFLAMLLLSLVFAIKTGFYLVDETVKDYLSIAGKGLAVLSLLVIALTVFWKLRYIPRSERRHLLTSNDSFVMQAMNQAGKTSWLLTFLLLCVISTTTKKDDAAQPAEFYLNLTMFFMLASFSLSFFFRFYKDKTESN